MAQTVDVRFRDPARSGSLPTADPSTSSGGLGLLPVPGDKSTGWLRTAAYFMGLASVVVVTVFWYDGGAVKDLSSSLANALTSLGRITGLLSADLLLLQVVLMARIPALEGAFGQDRLIRAHRLVGTASFVLLLLHIELTTAGYAITGNTDQASQLADFVRTYPDLLTAVVASGMITLVILTSIKPIRRRLRYERWHLLHWYAYLGIGLALPHELSNGNDFEVSMFATAYWWGLYGFALSAVIVWRFLIPVYRSLRHRLAVDYVVAESDDVVSVYVSGIDLNRLGARAGQFFIWRFLDGRNWLHGNPYSLSAAPTDTQLRLTVREVGDSSSRLIRLRPGTRVMIEGPYGRMHEGARRRRRVLLIAAGIGITPMRGLLEELQAGPGELTIIYRGNSPETMVLGEEVAELAQARGARAYFLVGPRGTARRRSRRSWLPAGLGDSGDLAALSRMVPRLTSHDVYICGPDAWTRSVLATLRQAGVPAPQIHTEEFTW